MLGRSKMRVLETILGHLGLLVPARTRSDDRASIPPPSEEAMTTGSVVTAPRSSRVSDVGVIGGGVLGMTLALRLRRSGHSVTVIEGAAATGGLAAPQSIGRIHVGPVLPRHPHVRQQPQSAARRTRACRPAAVE